MNLYEIDFFKVFEDGTMIGKRHQLCVRGGQWDACAQLGQIFNSPLTGDDYEIEIISVKKVN